MAGGCSTLFHLFTLNSVLVASLGLAGLASQISSNPGPGDRLGTSAMLKHMEKEYVKIHPEIPAQMADIRKEFDSLKLTASDDQVSEVLHYTDACTDAKASQLSPDDRREAAWLLYLDSYAREGPAASRKLFAHYSPPNRP